MRERTIKKKELEKRILQVRSHREEEKKNCRCASVRGMVIQGGGGKGRRVGGGAGSRDRSLSHVLATDRKHVKRKGNNFQIYTRIREDGKVTHAT